MKVAYILPSLLSKGPIVVINNLITELSKKGVECEVFYFDSNTNEMEFCCPTHKIDFDTQLDLNKFDIVHSNMYRSDKYVHKWYKTINRNTTKLISTIHQDIYSNIKLSHNIIIAFVLQVVWKRYLKIFDRTVVISNKLLTLYQKALPQSTTVYNGVMVDYKPQEAEVEITSKIVELKNKGLKLLGCYATLNKVKGVDQVFTLLERRNDLGFVLIGEGKEKDKLYSLAKKKGFDDRVLILPYLQKPYNYLEHIDIYMMPSRSEGFGMAMVEAAITKTPVVCSNLDVFAEIFDENEVCFFELENTTSLEITINKALDKGHILKENAYIKATRKFTAQSMAANYLTLYNDVLK